MAPGHAMTSVSDPVCPSCTHMGCDSISVSMCITSSAAVTAASSSFSMFGVHKYFLLRVETPFVSTFQTMSNDADNIIVDDTTAPEEPIGTYETQPIRSRKRERKALDKPSKRSVCFFCNYVGERDTSLPQDDVMDLVDALHQNIGQMESVSLATMISNAYEALRVRKNERLRRGETGLPPMNPATVLEHIRKHTQDAEVKQIVMLEELQEIREQLMDIMFEQHSVTKQRRPNKAAFDCLDKILKLEMVVQSKDASKMAFYSAGARVNTTALKQGAVSTAHKQLISEWRQKRAKE